MVKRAGRKMGEQYRRPRSRRSANRDRLHCRFLRVRLCDYRSRRYCALGTAVCRGSSRAHCGSIRLASPARRHLAGRVAFNRYRVRRVCRNRCRARAAHDHHADGLLELLHVGRRGPVRSTLADRAHGGGTGRVDPRHRHRAAVSKIPSRHKVSHADDALWAFISERNAQNAAGPPLRGPKPQS